MICLLTSKRIVTFEVATSWLLETVVLKSFSSCKVSEQYLNLSSEPEQINGNQSSVPGTKVNNYNKKIIFKILKRIWIHQPKIFHFYMRIILSWKTTSDSTGAGRSLLWALLIRQKANLLTSGHVSSKAKHQSGARFIERPCKEGWLLP